MRRFALVRGPVALVASGMVALFLSGCESCEKKPAPEPTVDAGSATTTPDAAPGAAEANADAGAADAGKARDMANCPTAVPGAAVAIKDVAGGVEVSITGSDDATATAIKDRMKRLVEAERAEREAGVRHTGKGEGGGIYGRCTIVMRDTVLTTSDLPNGSKAVVKAKDTSEVDWLRRETRERDKDAKAPGADTAGAQRMANCPSAAEGAKTVVKDVEGGVTVTVTGSGAVAEDIRARAKHLAEVTKKGAPEKIEHTGAGTGGGGLGRCPVVFEKETTIAVKDIDGGTEITVTTAKDVATLRKEARARAANFAR